MRDKPDGPFHIIDYGWAICSQFLLDENLVQTVAQAKDALVRKVINDSNQTSCKATWTSMFFARNNLRYRDDELSKRCPCFADFGPEECDRLVEKVITGLDWRDEVPALITLAKAPAPARKYDPNADPLDNL